MLEELYPYVLDGDMANNVGWEGLTLTETCLALKSCYGCQLSGTLACGPVLSA